MVADGLLHCAVYFIDQALMGICPLGFFLFRRKLSCTFRPAFFRAGCQHRIKISADPQPAVFPDQIVTRLQPVYALEEGFRQHGILEGHVLLQCLEIDLALISRIFQDALNLRAVYKAAADCRIVKGLDAEHVARAEELFFARIPDHEGKHSAQPVQDPGPVLRIAVKKHFRV